MIRRHRSSRRTAASGDFAGTVDTAVKEILERVVKIAQEEDALGDEDTMSDIITDETMDYVGGSSPAEWLPILSDADVDASSLANDYPGEDIYDACMYATHGVLYDRVMDHFKAEEEAVVQHHEQVLGRFDRRVRRHR